MPTVSSPALSTRSRGFHPTPTGPRQPRWSEPAIKEVTFTYAFFIPGGVWDQPHIDDAHLVVASGELQLGYGTSFNPNAAGRHAAGSFLYVPAMAVHFDGADEDTILLGTAVGPWSTDYVER